MLVELGIAHPDVFALGIGRLDFIALATLLMNFDVNATDKALGHDISLQVHVMTRMCDARIFMPDFGECYDWLLRRIVIVLIT